MSDRCQKLADSFFGPGGVFDGTFPPPEVTKGGPLDALFAPPKVTRFFGGEPGLKVFPTKAAYEVEIDLPGRVRDDVTVDISGNKLYVKVAATGSRNPRPEKTWVFDLGTEYDPEGTTALLEKGVLSLRVPRLKTADPPRFRITVG